MRNYIFGHTSEETAKTVTDYPWGFRLRTEQRYWVETSDRHGQRFVTQTKNPKTGRWCKPKKSTYESIVLMYENEKGHVSYGGLGKYSVTEENTRKILDAHRDNLTDWQKEKCKELIATDRVMSKVKFEIVPSKTGPVDLFSTDPAEKDKVAALVAEQEEQDRAEKETLKKINTAINQEFRGMEL